MTLETRRDKLMYGLAIPLLAAILGAIVGAVVQHMLSAEYATDSIEAIVSDKSLSSDERLAMLKAVNQSNEKFWDFIRLLLLASLVPAGMIVKAIADRITNRPYK